MKRGTVIAVAVFAALLLLVLVTREDRVAEGVPRFTWQAPEEARVTRVEVQGPKSALLVKGAQGWRVANPATPEVTFAADEGLVSSFFSALKDFKVGDAVTSQRERQAELEVDEAKGLTLKLGGEGRSLGALVFGKAAKSGGLYVREASAADVFVTSSRLGNLLKRDVSGWRKRAILGLKAEDLVALEVRRDGSELKLQANAPEGGGSPVWAVEPMPPPPFRFDASAAQRLAQQVAGLSAQDFSDDAAVATQAAQLVARTKDGQVVTLNLGVEANGTVPLRVEGDAQVYLLAAATAKLLERQLEDLRELGLWSFDVEKAQRLTVVTGPKRTVAVKEGGVWKVLEPKAMPAGFDFDPSQVAAVVSRLRLFKALRYDGSPEAQAACRKPATATVEVVLEGGARQQLRFGGELKPNELCATGSLDALTYAVSAAERSWLERGVELFKRLPPPPSFPHGGAQGLDQLPPELRAKIEQQLRQQQLQPH